MVDAVDRLRTVLAGQYAVDRELGRGGMATVYLAEDLKHGRPVAIKVLRPTLAESLGPARFLREIRIASRLTHPNILPLHESGEAEGLLFYVMPFVAGESVRDRLRREGQLPVEDAVQIAREVAQGLAYAHGEDVVHRDVKPENILLEAGQAVIADFGLARAIHAAALDDLSSAGLAVGTPAYMSPEQASGGNLVDGRSDVYSLGCVLYEMLAGEPPFTGPSAQAIAAKHLQLLPPPLRTVRPHVTDPVVAAVERALEKVPGDRFQTAEEFGRALTAGSAVEAPWRGARRRRVLGWGGLAIIGLALLGGLLLQRDGGIAGSRQAASGARAVSEALDPTHLAVLYFDSPERSMRAVADGLTEELIDQLGQVAALSVISANGVRPFRERVVPLDSLAETLAVGTLVTGTITGSPEDPRVTVRLIDAATGRQLDSRVLESAGGDVLTLRRELAEEVSGFLRERLGREIRLGELRASTKNSRAWLLVRRVDDLRQDARTLFTAGDTGAAERSLDRADSMLALAERLDTGWVTPTVLRGWIAADRIDIASTASAITTLAPNGIAHAERALSRQPAYPTALELRGYLRLLLWQYATEPTPDQVEAAERDLRAAAVPENPSYARAQQRLAYLLLRRGSFAEANLAARRAYEADAFLADASQVLFSLYMTSLLLHRLSEASDWCERGYRRFPDQWLFTLCRLYLQAVPGGAPPSPSQAWRMVAEMERITPPSEWVVLAPRWQLLVASVLARAGQYDSARRTMRAAKELGAADHEMDFYEANVRVLLGDENRALSLLERYVAHFPVQRPIIQGHPTFQPLQQHPRFRALVAARPESQS